MSITETPPIMEPAALDSEVVASVQDLHVSFKAGDGIVRALRGVNLDIRAGEVVALVGESGSGKSVLGMSLLGLLPASGRPETSGHVEVAGVDMLSGADKTRRKVRQELLGAVFQDPLTSLNPTMKIGRQLLERGIDKDRALRQLAEAGVPDPEQPDGPVPAPALRRPPPAGDDRDGARRSRHARRREPEKRSRFRSAHGATDDERNGARRTASVIDLTGHRALDRGARPARQRRDGRPTARRACSSPTSPPPRST